MSVDTTPATQEAVRNDVESLPIHAQHRLVVRTGSRHDDGEWVVACAPERGEDLAHLVEELSQVEREREHKANDRQAERGLVGHNVSTGL